MDNKDVSNGNVNGGSSQGANPQGDATQGENSNEKVSNSNAPAQEAGTQKTQSNGAPKSADVRKLKKQKSFSWVEFLIIFTVLSMISFGFNIYTESIFRGPEVSLSEIFEKIAKSDDSKSTIYLKDDVIVLSRQSTKDESKKPDNRHAVISNSYTSRDLTEDLKDYDVLTNDYELKVQRGTNVDLMINVLWLVLFAVAIFLTFNMIKGMQASGGKLMDFGQSKARLMFGRKTGITFDHVAGIDEVKEELIEIVDFLRHPKKYFEIGARIPKGVLLVGAPGTGKTLLAKAVAGEAGVPFFHTSGSEFEEMLVGAGASRVRDLFTKAKRAAPCIVFIDEIDAVAKKRGTVLHSGAGEQTLNQILVEMDGLEERENVIILAATNRPDVLDPAILRPGRFDRTVTVHRPDFKGRQEILAVHAKGKKFEADINMDSIAKQTTGYSGADLENLLNEAAIMAARDGRKQISNKDLSESYLKVRMGRQKKGKNVDADIELIAYHEAGHAVVAKFTEGSNAVDMVSIISRGETGGVTLFVPTDDRSIISKKRMMAGIITSVGGRIAEEVFLDDISTGASGDIQQATDTAKAMIQNYGMSEKLGFVKYGSLEDVTHLGYQYGGERDYSEQTARIIDEEVKSIMDSAQNTARKILKENADKVKELVGLLIEKEQVSKEEFAALFEK